MPVHLEEPWRRLSELVDLAPNLAALRAHRVHLFAAQRWRADGRVVPAELRSDEVRSAVLTLAAEPLLTRIRDAYAGVLMLVKGAEAAAHHPHPQTRAFRDLDLLVDDPTAAQHALLRAGFVRGGSDEAYADKQHLAPLMYPGLPLVVELHRWPNCPSWIRLPPMERVLKMAVPSRTGIPGIVAPAAPVHALLIAAHSWTDGPPGRLIDLVDIVALLDEDDRVAADRLAREWGWLELWRTTVGLADAVFSDREQPLALRTWARHLATARERTVLEDHVARLVGPVATVGALRRPRVACRAIAQTGARRPGESWTTKLHRSRLALTHAFTEKSRHESLLDAQTRRAT